MKLLNYGTIMEQHREENAAPPPSPTESSSITKEEFIKEIEITV